MSEPDTIECRPTKWFLWRALALFAMFFVFAVLFFKDWKVGYPKKNLVYYTHKAFEDAKTAFGERRTGLTKAAWEAFTIDRKLPVPEDGMLPEGADTSWPEELRDFARYKPTYEAEAMKTAPPGWIDYSDKMGWDEKPPAKSYDAAKIRNQFIYGVVSGLAALVTLGVTLRTMRRSMKADAEAFHSPAGRRIPYDRMRRIDKRKWETKGLAHIFYEDEQGRKQRAKVDGMVYGQFRAEDGAPAERLFGRILKNFSGELVELEEGPDATAAEPDPKEAAE